MGAGLVVAWWSRHPEYWLREVGVGITELRPRGVGCVLLFRQKWPGFLEGVNTVIHEVVFPAVIHNRGFIVSHDTPSLSITYLGKELTPVHSPQDTIGMSVKSRVVTIARGIIIC
jgi:hypothetical protein